MPQKSEKKSYQGDYYFFFCNDDGNEVTFVNK